MSDLEVLLTDVGETTTRALAKKHKPEGLEKNKEVAKLGGKVANNTRKDIENLLGDNIVTKENYLNYDYLDNQLIEDK